MATSFPNKSSPNFLTVDPHCVSPEFFLFFFVFSKDKKNEFWLPAGSSRFLRRPRRRHEFFILLVVVCSTVRLRHPFQRARRPQPLPTRIDPAPIGQGPADPSTQTPEETEPPDSARLPSGQRQLLRLLRYVLAPGKPPSFMPLLPSVDASSLLRQGPLDVRPTQMPQLPVSLQIDRQTSLFERRLRPRHRQRLKKRKKKKSTCSLNNKFFYSSSHKSSSSISVMRSKFSNSFVRSSSFFA